jgi:UDP-GlcNAc3NAcA epimerase
MIKILTIVGARPQFIKAGTLSRYIFENHINEIEEIIVHTGQHYDANMSDIFFEEMNIPKPKYHLGIGGVRHGAMTGQMIEGIEKIALSEKPDWILVYGDTNSTLAGAIVASKIHIPLAHVEAGLRSFNNKMPEEINRILTDRVSNLLFCPTEKAMKNLISEGYNNFSKKKFINVGDIMYEGALYYEKLKTKPQSIISDEPFILATIHRAETTNSLINLREVVNALNEINKETSVIVPIHPRTRKILEKENLTIDFNLIDPVGYLEMIWLIFHSEMIITDSGGLQKEAYFFEKICLTMRSETEWVELIESGNNILVGTDKDSILREYNKGFTFKSQNKLIYGDGDCSKRIINAILEYPKE